MPPPPRPWSKTGEVERGTPRPVFDWLNALAGGFTVDVCASPRLAKCQRFYDRAKDGLAQSWGGEVVWCNPPYGEGIGDWTAKGRRHAMTAQAVSWFLLPSRPDAAWYRETVMGQDGAAGALRRTHFDARRGVLWLRWARLLTGIHVLPRRLAFEGAAKHTAPFPSVIVVHAPPWRRWRPRSRTPPTNHDWAVDLTAEWPP